MPRYNAPELLQSDSVITKINPRKCDVWALGLLCWEIHRQGLRYFEDSHIQGLIPQSPTLCELGDYESKPLDPRYRLSEASSQVLLSMSFVLAEEASKWVDRELKIHNGWSHFDKLLLKGIFKGTLKSDASQRTENVSRLPLVHLKRQIRKGPAYLYWLTFPSNPHQKAIILEESASQTEWSIMVCMHR